ncbi:sulfite exporter TauE/SafE family protein [Zunongwangia endophytica]|uniref:Probable membrane transporter protein n=1 Tax=Zunongwangia endophytica TaxID=1808945 RepID=A0ABV8HCZ0_9FLAO|nr:sulfite exporter TauE/SafE family protein [Zunongwangia endophytica]MDN3593754.1 sulfite exporter TauE/SafE family protein [Zunongwangia endophytica]
MELAQVIGFIGALIIGLVLGLTGGGGSILTVPVFVYILHINPVTATAYSLFVVGSSSAVGAIDNFNKGRIDFKSSIIFALPAVIAIFSTRKFLLPAIPDHILNLGDFELTKDLMIMIFFGILMLLASISMIFKKDKTCSEDSGSESNPINLLMMFLGALTGIVTGLVGAGGGFIIVPILVFLAGLRMKEAVGTSLFIISINSIIGFLGDLGHLQVDWIFLFIFTLLSMVGIFFGIYLSRFINSQKLKKAFGYMVLVMGIYILWKELTASGI